MIYKKNDYCTYFMKTLHNISPYLTIKSDASCSDPITLFRYLTIKSDASCSDPITLFRYLTIKSDASCSDPITLFRYTSKSSTAMPVFVFS